VVQTSAHALNNNEQAWFSKAIVAIKSEHWKSASNFIKRVKSPLAHKYLVWSLSTKSNPISSFKSINSFLLQNPKWPLRQTLIHRAEELILSDLTPSQVIAWFGKREPISSIGHGRLAGALLSLGQKEKAIKIIRHAWVNNNFPRFEERNFYKKFRKYVTRQDHVLRLDRLVWEGKSNAARRMFSKVPKDWVTLTQARIHLRARSGNVDALIKKVPEKLINHPGLTYERLRWRRRKGKDSAFEILDNLPDDLVRPDIWWPERATLARRALSKGMISTAYRGASNHGLTEGADFAEAEWLSGWISLRFLNEFDMALEHFEHMYKSVNFPISRARGAYWAGRAKEAMGEIEAANDWFAIASNHPTTYYGQLAYGKLYPGDNLQPFKNPKIEIVHNDAFESHELVQVVRMLSEIKEYELIRPFIHHLYDLNSKPAWRLWTAHLAWKSQREDLAVWIAKRSSQEGVELPSIAYPVLTPPPLPHQLTTSSPELSFVLALIRQESAFRVNAISPAGARGLMQLMPRTAKNVSKHAKLRYSKSRLTHDPNYNMILGQTYLAELLKRQNNSYVLALVSYNAGPSRARRWIKDHGDLRNKDVDAIDWVEMIPFDETRNYVQRVMENLHVYRTRLAEADVALAPESDLESDK
jgi:soluble lytic murein transglycosylase